MMLTYAERIAWMQAAFPQLHRSEISARHHLFFVIGNGYKWREGQLARDEEPPVPTPQQVQARYRSAETYVSQNAAVRAWVRPDPTTLYPLCRYAALVTIPSDAQSDWLDAATQAIAWARTIRHSPEDALWLDFAEARLAVIATARKEATC